MSRTNPYQRLLEDFVQHSVTVFQETLVGVYLHGSAAMGCFHPSSSDLDLLVVVDGAITKKQKRAYLDGIVRLNRRSPAKGLEISVMQQAVCRPFVYPTPFELHFSPTHLDWYRSNPSDYLEKMQGVDKDLAAHITILLHRGKVLYGKAIKQVFAEVDRQYYLDSIIQDVSEARKGAAENPLYYTLNLCRVLAYGRQGAVFSKQEGGAWGLANLSAAYAPLLTEALRAYRTGDVMRADQADVTRFVTDVLEEIAQLTADDDGRRCDFEEEYPQ